MRRRALLLTIAAAAVSLLASGSATGSASPQCRASQLQGKLLDSSGAAGTIVLSVTLTNTGTRCTMRGYAGLILMHGVNPLTTNVLHGGLPILAQKPKSVLLAHGGAATILVAYSDVTTAGETRCPSSDAVLVRPPGQTNWLRAVAPAQACAHGTLRESPVLAGRRHAP